MKRVSLLIFLLICCCCCSNAFNYSRQDTLRGSNGTGRSWWDVLKYNLTVTFDTARQSISGSNILTFTVTDTPHDSLQIDLQEGMFLDKVTGPGGTYDYRKDGNVFWITGDFKSWTRNSVQSLTVTYHGRPRTAKTPPWDGGLIWTKDSMGKPWIAVACQGLGASSWWPCKDYQGDEPDSGMRIDLRGIPGNLVAVTNGNSEFYDEKLQAGIDRTDGSALVRSSLSFLKNPINTYNVTFYIGDYVGWGDTVIGEKGPLKLSFYALRHNEAKAREQFKVAKQMLHCFEHWMGPYPFYEDGYKLVEAPFLGMEHQSAIAYGNQYKMGYLGSDRSGTGIGNHFDYIIVHESGHEWFGNNITAQDIADNWIHEGFTTYSETLFTECLFNKDSAYRYMHGEWDKIRNDRPVIGDYGVNDDGSSDKYDKGAALVHMIRVLMNDDEKFRQLLRRLNKDFYHKMVTSAEVEAYIIRFTGLDLKPLFDQYLRTTNIPVLEYYMIGRRLKYRFKNAVPGFTLPISVTSSNKNVIIKPTGEWQTLKWKGDKEISFGEDFLYRQYYVLE